MKESISLKYFRTAFEKWFRKSGMKQFQAGIHLGISQSLVTKLLRGERGLSFAQADEIAKALNTTVSKMLIDGQQILEKNTHKNTTSEDQQMVLESFKYLLLTGGEAVELISDQVIRLAQKKQAEAEAINPTPAQDLKSA